MIARSTNEDEPNLTIALSRSEALVLDNLLWRWRDAGSPLILKLDHDAERHILAGVNALLTGGLVSFYSQDDYKGQIAAAREDITASWGAWQDEAQVGSTASSDTP